MASGYTSKYELCQWEPGDNFIRSEFNTDNAKTEAALLAVKAEAAQALAQVARSKCEIAVCTYIGNDVVNRAINVGFAPKAVIVDKATGMRAPPTLSGGLALAGHPVENQGWQAVTVTESGFTVSYRHGETSTNQKDMVYHYIAFR